MRITVRRLLEIIATYRERDEIFREYPFLQEEDLQQALGYAAASVDDDVRYLNQVLLDRGLAPNTRRWYSKNAAEVKRPIPDAEASGKGPPGIVAQP